MTIENDLKKTLCYISNIGNNTIAIMDIQKRVLTEIIDMPFKPFKMAYIDNKIYVSSNGSDIAVISTDDNHIEILNIPNNGNIVINQKDKKLYVSNTSQISIYDTDTYKLISTIKPFGIVDNFGLTSDELKIFTIDLLKKDLKIYDSCTFKLLSHIKNIGIKPCCALINDNNKVAYVASKSINNINSCYIYVVNLEDNYINSIELSDNSLITSLILKNTILYACNKGLNRIEVIDTLTNSLIKSISTTLPEPQNLLLTPNKDNLLVTNRNPNEIGCLDIIDTVNNNIIHSINIPGNNNEPYDIIAIIKDSHLPIENNEAANSAENLVAVTIKRNLTTFNEDILFSNIIVSLPESYRHPISLENIIFKKPLIINEFISPVPDEDGYFKVNFTLKIPYIVKFKGSNSKILTMKKFLLDNRDMKLQIPNVNNNHKLHLFVNTDCKLPNDPVLIKDIFKFSAQIYITLKIFSEFESMIPSYLVEI